MSAVAARASWGFEGGRSTPRQPQCHTLGRLAPRYYALRTGPAVPASHGAPTRRMKGGHARRNVASPYRIGGATSLLYRVQWGVCGMS